MGDPRPFVSVIVPVLGDVDRLAACLDALEDQTWPGDGYEILVVDNGPERGGCAAAAGRVHVRLLREEVPGSYAARNCGLGAARGELLAFTDADCIPAPDWIERGVERLLEEPGCGLVAGRIRLTVRDPRHPTAVELYESVAAFRQDDYVAQRHFGATANVFTTRAVMDRVGPFDPRLKSLGDVDWGVRVFEAGFRQLYAPNALVDHPARRTVGEFVRRSARMTRGFRDLRGTDRWPVGKRRRYAALGLPPLRAVLWGPPLRGPGQRLKVVGVVVLLLAVRVFTLARLDRRELLGRSARRPSDGASRSIAVAPPMGGGDRGGGS